MFSKSLENNWPIFKKCIKNNNMNKKVRNVLNIGCLEVWYLDRGIEIVHPSVIIFFNLYDQRTTLLLCIRFLTFIKIYNIRENFGRALRPVLKPSNQEKE